METIGYNKKITVFGVTFDNIRDVINHAISGEPNNGVYVGEDAEHYPCFDYEDYATENRFYWNFVFSTSKTDMQKKLAVLKEMQPLKANYNKLTQQLHPMAYWGGDTHEKVYVTEV